MSFLFLSITLFGYVLKNLFGFWICFFINGDFHIFEILCCCYVFVCVIMSMQVLEEMHKA